MRSLLLLVSLASLALGRAVRRCDAANNGTYLQAPQVQNAAPPDAVTFTPTGHEFDMTAFYHWRENVRQENSDTGAHGSRYLKVAPGNYTITYTDWNHASIDVTFWSGGWTLDLRGVTLWAFYTEDGPKTPDPIFYVNQAGPTFTILGGTIWLDGGPIYSQARVTSMKNDTSLGFDMSLVTLELEEGYDAGVWTDAGNTLRAAAGGNWHPPGISCVDDSNPYHTVLLDCNFWYMNPTSLNTNGRAVTMGVASRAGVKEGIVMSLVTGVQQHTTIVAEEMAGLIGKLLALEPLHMTYLSRPVVKGMTTNGGTMFIGHNFDAPPLYDDLYIVNMPTHPGFAPTVNPPTMSNGHAGDFELCEFAPHCQTYPNGKWQYSGNPNDIIDLALGIEVSFSPPMDSM